MFRSYSGLARGPRTREGQSGARARPAVVAGLLALLVAGPAAAQQTALGSSPAGDASEAPVPDPPSQGDPVAARAPEAAAVPLDALLKLPDSVEVGVDRRGKATEAEWRSRFLNAHLALLGARRDLSESQKSLEEFASSGQWSFSPPGVNVEASGNVDAHQLRMDIKRQRAEVERAERKLRELEVEANLASVPESWREKPGDS